MSDLFAAGCSITKTRRRRFLWAAWWTGPPTREPFRKPDAFHGGARTREDALREAELAAGVHVVELESRWARAWARILVGQPAWLEKEGTESTPRATKDKDRALANASVWSVLGVPAHATEDEIKRAFRKRALETHPDHGGEAAEFRSVQRAYEEALRRLARPRKRTAR